MKRAERAEQKGLVVREVVAPEIVGRRTEDGGLPYTPEELTQVWNMAVNGVRRVIAFGAMLCEVDASLSRETGGRGGGYTGETLKAWLAENCPEINYKTAMKFRRMAEITIAAAQQDYSVEITPWETAALLGVVPPKDGENAQRSTFNAQRSTGEGENAKLPTHNAQRFTDEEKRAVLERFLDGKSQRDVLQLWSEGGSRPGRVAGTTKALGAPRQQKTPDEIEREKRGEAAQALMTARNCLRALTGELGGWLNPATARGLLIDIRDDVKVIAANLER